MCQLPILYGLFLGVASCGQLPLPIIVCNPNILTTVQEWVVVSKLSPRRSHPIRIAVPWWSSGCYALVLETCNIQRNHSIGENGRSTNDVS